jgi:hypothetical protein
MVHHLYKPINQMSNQYLITLLIGVEEFWLLVHNQAYEIRDINFSIIDQCYQSM